MRATSIHRKASAAPLPGPRLSLARGHDRPRHHAALSETEQRLLDATEAGLAELGFAGLTVPEIVRRAGASKSNFYFYFSSGQSAVTACVARCLDELHDDFTAALATEGSPQLRIERSLEAGWRAWTRHGPVMRTASQHWPDIPMLQELWIETFDRFTTAIAAEIDAERVADRAPDGLDSHQLAALLLWGVERQAFVAGLEADRTLTGGESVVLVAVRVFWRQAIYGHV
jgi:AcrR family transcriptional regulator